MRGRPSTGAVVAACAAQFMVVLDVSVVNVALPSMRDDLAIRDSALSWVVNVYALTFAGFLLAGGRLADVYGVRRVFLGAVALFTVASAAGGSATSAGVLIAARAAQGLGAAALAPATLTLITTAVPDGPLRTRAIAVWTALGIAGGTAGNLLGGALTEWVGWRATLLINLPVGVVCAVLAAYAAPRSRSRRDAARLDVPGATLATGALASLAYGLNRFGEAPATGSAFVACSVVLAAAFVLVERRALSPIVPRELLSHSSVRIGNLLMMTAGACLNPVWYFLTLMMQNTLGYSPLQTGLAFLPHTLVAIAVGTTVTPRLMRYVQPKVLVGGGSLIAAAGFAWQARAGAEDGYLAAIAGPAIIFSIGSALLTTPLTVATTSGLPAGIAGAASGVMNTAKQAGAAVGLAAIGAVVIPPGTAAQPDGATYGLAFLIIACLMAVTAAGALLLPLAPEGRVMKSDSP